MRMSLTLAAAALLMAAGCGSSSKSTPPSSPGTVSSTGGVDSGGGDRDALKASAAELARKAGCPDALVHSYNGAGARSADFTCTVGKHELSFSMFASGADRDAQIKAEEDFGLSPTIIQGPTWAAETSDPDELTWWAAKLKPVGGTVR